MAHLNRRALFLGGPRERAFFQPFVQDPKSGLVPDQDLESVAAPIAKEKEMAGQGIQREALAHQRREPIDRASQIGGPGRHVDTDRR